MYKEAFLKISAEVSAERAFDHVIAVSRFHRIQASPGYRAAAEYCVDRLLETSPDSRVIHYPADPQVRFWSFPSFKEWHGKQGVLEIVKPASMAGKIADFEACPISLIQRSRPTPPEGLTSEIIYAGEGTRASDYRRGKGKIAICDAHCPRHVYDAAVEAGVAGVVLYRHRPLPPLRTGLGVEGVRQYNSFWWDEDRLFGFVLTPEDGQRLVAYITSAEGRRRPPTAWAMVESESYPGSMEVVTSLIPGRQKKEVLLIAHLCHPKPSAGDNASGVAALLEAHRVLARMVSNGELPRPEYGIRFLLVPEITGTFAYLSREKGARSRLMFGLNLDMVGQRQDVTGSTLCIEAPPLSAASFTPFLLEEVVRRAFFRHFTNPASTGYLPSIRLQATPFSGGSDHLILSDPTVGVPTPMLLQWPDKYYHTSGDTPDKVSPDTLCRIAIAASTYAYTIALAAEEDMLWLARLAGRGLRKKAIDHLGVPGTAARVRSRDQSYRAKVLLKASKQAISSVGTLLPRSNALKARIASEARAISACVKREAAISGGVGATAGGRRGGPLKYRRAVVKRLVRGPVDMGATLKVLGKRRRAQYGKWMASEKQAYLMQALGLFWADGKRSIAEISDHVNAELGYTNPDFLKFYFDALAEAGIVEISGR